MSFLGCALLLDGTITSTVDEEKADNHPYQNSRMLAAIAFYRKAACDATLAPIIEGRLWHIRTTSDNPVVVDELNKYHLTPIEFTSHYHMFAPAEGGDSFVLADLSNIPVPAISDSPDSAETPFISLNPWLVFGLFSSVAIGAVAIALLWSSAPAWVAIIGTGIVSVATVATCCFFYNARHDDRDNQREREYARHGII